MKETPRHHLTRLRTQVMNLEERYNINRGPPSLCNYCTQFWFERNYYEGDSDWGCRAGIDDEKVGLDKVRCGKFRPKKDWDHSMTLYLNSCLSEALNKVAPFRRSIRELKAEIDALESARVTANLEIEKSKMDFEALYKYKQDQLSKLIPAEIWLRMKGVKEECIV